MLPIGTQAPDIALPCQTGETVSLSQFAGKKIVLYVYPKDNTSGCTKQAQGFTELYDEFADELLNMADELEKAKDAELEETDLPDEDEENWLSDKEIAKA